MQIHKSITAERLAEVIQDSCIGYPGFCIACGEETDGVEPDAREYKCDVCGAMQVYGAEELLFMV